VGAQQQLGGDGGGDRCTGDGRRVGCGAPIKWQRLGGRWHPCDPAKVTIVAEDRVITGYVSHFATCPNADQFRKDSRTP
jgi:hypothetical protein